VGFGEGLGDGVGFAAATGDAEGGLALFVAVGDAPIT